MLTALGVAAAVLALGMLSVSLRVLPLLLMWRAKEREIRMLEDCLTRSAAFGNVQRDRRTDPPA